METLKTIYTRCSVREYKQDSLSVECIESLIEAAIHAPTTANRQAWSFTVISDRTLLDRISQEAKHYMTKERPLALPEYLYDKLATADFHVLYNAPALIVISGEINLPWMAEDCALAAQNLMLAAHDAGIGACWIGLVQPYLATDAGSSALRLGERKHPIAPIIVGWPAMQSVPPLKNKAMIEWINEGSPHF